MKQTFKLTIQDETGEVLREEFREIKQAEIEVIEMKIKIPSHKFWEQYEKTNVVWPPDGNCPRCGNYMNGGFWMHLCSDTLDEARTR